MPLYSFNCPIHGAFDLLLPMSEWNRETAQCQCGAVAERQAELCAMRPDSLWHFGKVVADIGEVNSSSKLARINRDRNIVTINGRADAEAMKKTAADARKGWDAQLERDTRKHFEEMFSGSGVVDSDGNLSPDAMRPQGGGDLKGEFSADLLAS